MNLHKIDSNVSLYIYMPHQRVLILRQPLGDWMSLTLRQNYRTDLGNLDDTNPEYETRVTVSRDGALSVGNDLDWAHLE